MRKVILNYVNKLEGYKTAIKSLHWDANSLKQHELCDDIADVISDFQDLVSEVEQSLSGNLPFNQLKGEPYKVVGLKTFVNDVISSAKEFLKSLEGLGEEYVGMKSETETFIAVMQRKLYLVNFTLKESFKMRLREAMYKNVPEGDDALFDKIKGRKPKTKKARINQIYQIVNKYGINSRLYKDEHWQAITDYKKVISSLGYDVLIGIKGGGYTDFDPTDHMPRSKEYQIEITDPTDNTTIKGYIKAMAAGTVEDPFSKYDTAMILWP